MKICTRNPRRVMCLELDLLAGAWRHKGCNGSCLARNSASRGWLALQTRWLRRQWVRYSKLPYFDAFISLQPQAKSHTAIA